MQSKNFGLIGKTLKHSFSKIIHKYLGDYDYKLLEIKEDELQSVLDSKEVSAFNVTIPYKTQIIPLLDEVDGIARDIGAVNTVVKRGDKCIGYNTDYYGMKYMLEKADITIQGKRVMILGTGGTSKTAATLAKNLGAKSIVKVSRSGEVNYTNCYDLKDTEIIINTTPVGMFPESYQAPVDISRFSKLEGVGEVIYNPSRTMLLDQARKLGVKRTSALYMLIGQAKYASELFTGEKISDDKIDEIYNILTANQQNVLLIGMPGSGKSTIGRAVAEAMGREFIDTDEQIVLREGKDIPTVFKEMGEEYFRKVESEVLKDVCKKTGVVISTGGGIILNEENEYPMRSNGKIFYIDRSVEKLASEGRPLSKSREDIQRLYELRKDKYQKFKDISIDNNGDLQSAIDGVLKNL